MEHEILLSSDVEGFPYEGLLKRCITTALEAEDVAVPCEVDVLITDDEGIHQINLEQRAVDAPTDVLSFPMFYFTPGTPPTEEDAETDPETGLLPLGDMVISYQRAVAQAEEYGHSVERELGYLSVHSVLHLLGYDHMDGEDGPMKRQMRAREEAIMASVGIPRA
ncbi:MAG: rRNA maturation RNase YbeY [Clostridiales bacterium]|nr:rRNA maturation RNase YbeY [Clostridiales bacterium]